MGNTLPVLPGLLRPALAGIAATLSGVGLSRFAYVPLFPAMVAAGWITGAEGALLGALNLAGYLAGVLGGRSLAARLGTPRALDLGLVAAAIAFLACGFDGGVAWLAWWRFVSGAAGGALMALAGPAVQGAVASHQRGLAGGITISGVAIGIVLGALLVPVALPYGVPAAWIGLSAMVMCLLALAHGSWPVTPISSEAPAAPARAARLYTAYGLSGAGLVPHMVYFGDLAVRGRGLTPADGAALWLVFGIGALCGPILAGRTADRYGARSALRTWLAAQVAALSAALFAGFVPLCVSAALGGFSALGLTAICLARARELAGPASAGIWVRATASFAVAQAVAGLALAGLFRATGSHDQIFGAGLVLSAAALVVALGGRETS